MSTSDEAHTSLFLDGWFEALESIVDFPAWPIGRPQLATRSSRLNRTELRQAFAAYVQRLQRQSELHVLPACTWCGQPTGGYCDFCSGNPKAAICSACGGTDSLKLAACRQCAFTPNVQIQSNDLKEIVLCSLKIYSDDPDLPRPSQYEFFCQCQCGCSKPLRLIDSSEVERQRCWECRENGCICQCIGCEAGRLRLQRRELTLL